MNYGRALKIARAMKGLEQKDLAKLARLDPSHISLIEQGKRNPTVATIERIARALKIPHHLLTLMASESKDLKYVDSERIRELGEMLAQTLLSDERVHKTRTKTSRPRSHSKA